MNVIQYHAYHNNTKDRFLEKPPRSPGLSKYFLSHLSQYITDNMSKCLIHPPQKSTKHDPKKLLQSHENLDTDCMIINTVINLFKKKKY